MTGRTIKAHDPDLDQTIIDMSAATHRLAIAEADLLRMRREENHHGIPAAVARVAAIRDTIAARAGRLQIKPASALRLIVEQHEYLRQKMGRRPNMEQLEASVAAAADLLARQALADDAAAAEAESIARRSRHMAGAGVAAGAYLRSCA